MPDLDVDHVKTRLKRIGKDVDATRASMVAWAFDFHLDLEDSRRFKSTLIIRTNGHPSQFVLRYPAWHPDAVDRQMVEDVGRQVLELPGAPEDTEMRIERQTGGEWALHIQNSNLQDPDLDDLLTFFRKAQREWAEEFQGGMLSSEIHGSG